MYFGIVVATLQTIKVIFRTNILATIFNGIRQFSRMIAMFAASHFNDIAGRIMVAGTLQIQCAQKWYQLLGIALIHALSVRQCVQLIEHFEKTRRRLVNGANDGAATACQKLQQIDALETC